MHAQVFSSGSVSSTGKRIKTVLIGHRHMTTTEERFWVYDPSTQWRTICDHGACTIGVYDLTNIYPSGADLHWWAYHLNDKTSGCDELWLYEAYGFEHKLYSSDTNWF